MSDERPVGYTMRINMKTGEHTLTPDASELAAPNGSALWEAYGPSQVPLTFDHESFVGPTEINDVRGPLCVVSGATDEESLFKAKRISDLLNQYGLSVRNAALSGAERNDEKH